MQADFEESEFQLVVYGASLSSSGRLTADDDANVLIILIVQK